MDLMDYTMEDGQRPQNQNSSQCTNRQSQQPSMSNNFFPPPSNPHHYDPVYNRDSWFQPSQLQFPPPQNVPQWGQGPHPGNWQNFQETSGGMRDENSIYGQAGYLGGQFAGPDPLPFGYDRYHTHNTNHLTADSGNARGSMPVAATSIPNPPGINRYNQGRPFPYPPNPGAASSLLGPNPTQSGEIDRLMRASRTNMRLAQTTRDYPGPTGAFDIPNAARRRAAQRYEPSDDGDDSPGSSGSPHAHSRYGDNDDERMMASLRGVMPTSKKVPSKETIASFERLELEDLELEGKSKSCVICYNDFFELNGDGFSERPIRLPKCKHIYGEKCIEKWFETSDTCPYCRDKIPSERAAPRSQVIYEAMNARYRERVEHIRAAGGPAANTVAPNHRARPSFIPRHPPSDELARYTAVEEQLSAMRSIQQPEAWSFSPPNTRTSPRDSERRRQQARGRASSGRPNSSSNRYSLPSSGSHNPNAMETPLRYRTRQHADFFPVHSYYGSINAGSPEASSPAVANGSNPAAPQHTRPPYHQNGVPATVWHDLHHDHSDRSDNPPPGTSNDFSQSISFESRTAVSTPRSPRLLGDMTNQNIDAMPFGFRQSR